MSAVARDLYFSLCILTALAAVLFVICYGASACGMRTFLLLNISHGSLPFLSTDYRDKNVNERIPRLTLYCAYLRYPMATGNNRTQRPRRIADLRAARL